MLIHSWVAAVAVVTVNVHHRLLRVLLLHVVLEHVEVYSCATEAVGRHSIRVRPDSLGRLEQLEHVGELGGKGHMAAGGHHGARLDHGHLSHGGRMGFY